MHIPSALRTLTLALAITAAMGAMTAAFADDSSAPTNSQQQSTTNTPYDNDNFMIDESNVQS